MKLASGDQIRAFETREVELSTLVRNYGDVIASLCQAAVVSAFAESLVNKALRSLRVKDH